jgi:Flp pilus assembly secretin CpaC
VQVKSPRMVYLLAKKVGETSLFGVGRGDDLVTSLKVRVVHDLA